MWLEILSDKLLILFTIFSAGVGMIYTIVQIKKATQDSQAKVKLLLTETVQELYTNQAVMGEKMEHVRHDVSELKSRFDSLTNALVSSNDR